jgi:hypothetical protein
MPRATETPWEKGAGPVLILTALGQGAATSIATLVGIWSPYWRLIASALAAGTLVIITSVVIVGLHHLHRKGRL